MRSIVKKQLVLLLGLLTLSGCAEQVVVRPEPVEVTVTANGADGKPLPASIKIMLRPTTAAQAPTSLSAKTDGQFSGKVLPGKYQYTLVKASGGEDVPPGIPAKYGTASDENVLEVPPTGGALTIKLSN